MFGRKARRKEFERKTRIDAHTFAIERVHKYERITLAIARFTFWEAYNWHRYESEELSLTPDMFEMNGVVHEHYNTNKHVLCEVTFNPDPADRPGDPIGSATLSESGLEQGASPEDRDLVLLVNLRDPNRIWANRTLDAMRDAALSGAQFFHVSLQISPVDPAVAIAAMSEKGYGPRIPVRGYALHRDLVMPKAPRWAWKSTFE